MRYVPARTVREFMRSDARVKAIIGPLGSGKSMGGLMDLFRRMVEQEPDSKNIRPTRFVITRNTAAQLRETVLSDAKSYFGDYFTHKVSTGTMEFRFDLGDGTTVESDWLLVPLERPEDQRKLLSLNITSALIEECREIPYDVIAAVLGRIGRFPPKSRVSPTWHALLMISNPWSVSSDYHTNLVINRPATWDFFHQPGGLDPDAEGAEFLPKDYYKNLMDGNSPEWINVHVRSQFGEDMFGRSVYKAVFNGDTHLRDNIEPDRNQPLLLGMDFGRTPCAVLTQEDFRGRLFVLEEITSQDMGLDQFLQVKLLPRLAEAYPAFKIFVVGDPAGSGRDQYSEDNAFSVIRSAGLEAIPAPTNDPLRRVQAVERRLLANTGDTPNMLISRKCTMLVEGFMRGYRYRKKKNNEITASPDKNKFSHIHDAMQYAVLGHQFNYVAKVVHRRNTMSSRPKVHVSAKAWT